jgi:hypothetical protein
LTKQQLTSRTLYWVRGCKTPRPAKQATLGAVNFGPVDSLKFRSSMTLFAQCEPGSVFQKALEMFFDGVPDARTLEHLRGAHDSGDVSRKPTLPRVSSTVGRQLIDITRTSEVLEFLDEQLPLEKRR